MTPSPSRSQGGSTSVGRPWRGYVLRITELHTGLRLPVLWAVAICTIRNTVHEAGGQPVVQDHWAVEVDVVRSFLHGGDRVEEVANV